MSVNFGIFSKTHTEIACFSLENSKSQQGNPFLTVSSIKVEKPQKLSEHNEHNITS